MQHRSWALVSAAAAGLVASVLVANPPALAASGTVTQPAPITLMHHSGPASGSVQEPLVIPDQGGASSELTLVGPVDAVVTWVDVEVTLDHAHFDDLDLVLEAPDGRAITLASDIGGDTSGEGTLYFDQTAAPLPDGTLADSNVTAAPADYDTLGDLDAHPGNPPATFRPLGGTLLSGPGDGVWTLHAYDDTAGNEGSVQSWTLDVYFGLPAAPNPSTLAVSGMPRDLTDVNLVLSDVDGGSFGRDSLNSVELMLESPDGRYAHVLSDTGAEWEQTLDLTLDDEATADLPQFDAVESRGYRPRNYDDQDQSEPIGGVDTMDMEADLSVLDGGPANGTWKLWVFQEYCCNTLTIGSWSLQITAEDPPVPPGQPSTGAADTTAPVLSDVRLTPRRLPTGVGARLRVASSESAKLVGLVQRRKTGEWKRVGTKGWTVQPGANTRLFYGKTAQGQLRSGIYRVLLVATDAAGNASAEVRRRFRVDRG